MILFTPTTARYLAPSLYTYNLIAQLYGMLSTPNMKTINDAHQSFFSPYPWFIAGFFSFQQLLQIAYCIKLWSATASAASSSASEEEKDLLVSYAPFFALGNAAIGTWMFFWNAEMLRTSNVFCWINTLGQLYYMFFQLPPLAPRNNTSLLVHLTNKTFAGIGVLDILHNTSIAYFEGKSASALIKVLTGVGFGAGIVGTDAIFGACLVYDLVGLSVGQSGSWRALLGLYAAVGAVLVAGKAGWWYRYGSKRDEQYKTVPEEEEDTRTGLV